MKRITMILMILTLVCAMAPALADNATIIPERAEDEPIRTIQDEVGVGDTVYFKVRTDEDCEIWTWSEGMPRAEKWLTGLTFASSYTDIAQAYEELDAMVQAGETRLPDVEHAIACLFTDGQELYAFNSLNQRVFTIGKADGEAVYTDVVTLPEHKALYTLRQDGRYFFTPDSACVAGGYLLWEKNSFDPDLNESREMFYAFDLKTGEAKEISLAKVLSVLPYKEDKALVVTRKFADSGIRGEYVLTLYTLDPATGELTEKDRIQTNEYLGQLTYSAKMDTLFYGQNGKIMGKHNFGEPQVYATVPLEETCQLAVAGNSIILEGYQVTLARTLTAEYTPAVELNVSADEIVGAADFAEKYPDVRVNRVGVTMDSMDELFNRRDEWIPRLMEGESAADVICGTTTDGIHVALREENLLMDLSESEIIREYVENLYPPFKEMAMQDGKIVAVPINAQSEMGYFVNRRVMNDMGIRLEEVPTDFVSLCEFITKWNDRYTTSWPNYTVVEYAQDYRSRILTMMLRSWKESCYSKGEEIHYDDPVFRQLLTALDGMKFDKLEAAMNRPNPEDSDYMQGLIWDGCLLVGNFASYMEEFSDRAFLPMKLTADSPYTVYVEHMTMWSVNANTTKKEYAIALVEEQILKQDKKQRAVLLTTATEAVPNPEYPQIKERTEKALKDMQDISYVYCDEAYWKIYEATRLQKDFIKTGLLRQQYRVTPSAMKNYQAVVAPAMFVRYQDPSEVMNELGQSILHTITQRYADREIDAETFIRLADLSVEIADEATTDPQAMAIRALQERFGHDGKDNSLLWAEVNAILFK